VNLNNISLNLEFCTAAIKIMHSRDQNMLFRKIYSIIKCCYFVDIVLSSIFCINYVLIIAIKLILILIYYTALASDYMIILEKYIL